MVSEHSILGVDDSSTSAMRGVSNPTSKFVLVPFNHSLSIRLDNINYLVWRKQVLSTIQGHKLQDFHSWRTISTTKVP